MITISSLHTLRNLGVLAVISDGYLAFPKSYQNRALKNILVAKQGLSNENHNDTSIASVFMPVKKIIRMLLAFRPLGKSIFRTKGQLLWV